MKSFSIVAICSIFFVWQYADAFIISSSTTGGLPFPFMTKGDKLRESTGIRPSLHPITINAIAEALKRRSKGEKLRIGDGIQPIDVATTAGMLAEEILRKRRDTSEQDDMLLTPEEEQTIAGRIVGVVMRFDDLEESLYKKVSNVGWVKKYDEWSSFGVLSEENEVDLRIAEDPLFAMSRAECLLAVFLHTVETPKLKEMNTSVPGGSDVDFIDSDRFEVLIEKNDV